MTHRHTPRSADTIRHDVITALRSDLATITHDTIDPAGIVFDTIAAAIGYGDIDGGCDLLCHDPEFAKLAIEFDIRWDIDIHAHIVTEA